MTKYREPTVDDVGKIIEVNGIDTSAPWKKGRLIEIGCGFNYGLNYGKFICGCDCDQPRITAHREARIAVEEKFESKLCIPMWVESFTSGLANHLSMAIANIVELEKRIWELERK